MANSVNYQEFYQSISDLCNGDTEWTEQHGLVQPDELVADSVSEDTFYCGICGHSPISTFPHSH